MNPIAPLIVLLEGLGQRRTWSRGLIALALILGPWASTIASAQAPTLPPQAKIARDLATGLADTGKSKTRWMRDLNGVRTVQAIVVSNSSDPAMTDLRAAVLRMGGSIHAVHPAVRALTVQVRAGDVLTLAQRRDVASVSPNRVTRRTNSTLEAITGTLTNNVRTGNIRSNAAALDGSGIGIAVLDSGVMKAHDAFFDGSATRVRRNVDVRSAGAANWITGTSGSTSLVPGSAELAAYEAAIANDGNLTQDPYGHGTHVASIAAGSARYYGSATPDTTGIAPNASVYDVRALDDSGAGTLSDAIQGIQWVIYHAREYNIKVLNVSLAANSPETWLTDPLCVAVRSATIGRPAST